MQAGGISDEDDECLVPVNNVPIGKRTLAERSVVCETQPTWDSDDDIVPVKKRKKVNRKVNGHVDFSTKRLFAATCKEAQDIAFAGMDAGYEVEIYNMQNKTSINVPTPDVSVYGVYEYREKDSAGVAMDVVESHSGKWDYGHDELVGTAVAAKIIGESIKENPNRVVIVASKAGGEAARTLLSCVTKEVTAKFKYQKATARSIIGHRATNPSDERLREFCNSFASWKEVEEEASKLYAEWQ
jgi:hypothetical protein